MQLHCLTFTIQLKCELEYLMVSSCPLCNMLVKYGVDSVIRALPTGTNTQQKLYKQNPVDVFYMCTEKHQHMNYADA